MYYMGSKARHAAEIIVITCANRGGCCYVEPFVGGGNVICRVPHTEGPRIGSDINWRMIELLDAVGNRGWLPPQSLTEDEFDKIKASPDAYPPELVAFAATALTFGSQWFAGWARNKKDTPADKAEGRPALQRQGRQACIRDAPGLSGIKFYALRYQDLVPHIPPRSIIYCDPPYAGTSGYGGAKTNINVGQDLALNVWDRVAFWRWADEMTEAGHRVFVSEYAGPPASIYSSTSSRREAVTARFRALQADQGSTREDREAAAAEVRAIQQEEKTEAARLAARWSVLWEKEVVSDFGAHREAGVRSGKVEIEKLLHRAP